MRGDRAQDKRDAARLIYLSLKLRRHAPGKAAAGLRALVVLRALYTEAVRRQRSRQGKVNRIRCSCSPIFPPRHVQQIHCGRPSPKRGDDIC